jgi:hypothetical protein
MQEWKISALASQWASSCAVGQCWVGVKQNELRVPHWGALYLVVVRACRHDALASVQGLVRLRAQVSECERAGACALARAR